MRLIAQRIWREPAAAIGFATSLALLIGAKATGADWDAATILAILAPLASSLGVRGFVSPVTGTKQELPGGVTAEQREAEGADES